LESSSYSIATFISPHGYGHAARASAVMAALHRLNPGIRFEIFTLVPQWFFQNSLQQPFGYHALMTDIGLAQVSAIEENLSETVRQLDDFLPFEQDMLGALARQLESLNCRLVLCDIAPLGIAVAKEAGLPSVLVENFTWDWIYQGYFSQAPRLEPFAAYFGELFRAADYHIQTEPLCDPQPGSLIVPPISRSIRAPADEVRRRLEAPQHAPLVMVTMGGIQWQFDHLSALEAHPDCYFLVPGAAETVTRRGHLIALPHQSEFFHPDLVNASDAVIGKVGYSTLAEVYQAGIPYGYVPRLQFRESRVLVDYIRREMQGLPLSVADFEAEAWLSSLPGLLALPRFQYQGQNGAAQAADFISQIIPA
jgi:hypothetical protein